MSKVTIERDTTGNVALARRVADSRHLSEMSMRKRPDGLGLNDDVESRRLDWLLSFGPGVAAAHSYVPRPEAPVLQQLRALHQCTVLGSPLEVGLGMVVSLLESAMIKESGLYETDDRDFARLTVDGYDANGSADKLSVELMACATDNAPTVTHQHIWVVQRNKIIFELIAHDDVEPLRRLLRELTGAALPGAPSS